jgi:hypothetical protein
LIDGLGAGLDGGVFGQFEHPQHLHRPVTGLGAAASAAAEDRPGGGFGVEGVGLAPSAAGGLVGCVDLDHLDPGHPQVPGQRRTVGPGALHPGPPQHPEATHPAQQRPIADRSGREVRAAQQHPQRRDDRGDVHVVVGIHPQYYLLGGAVVLVV